jgi:hypothetical protein
MELRSIPTSGCRIKVVKPLDPTTLRPVPGCGIGLARKEIAGKEPLQPPLVRAASAGSPDTADRGKPGFDTLAGQDVVLTEVTLTE